MEIEIGPSEMQVGDMSEVILLTSSLGSGVGVAIYDSKLNVGGLLHFLLPSSGNFRSRAKNTPLLFADTGIPILIEAVVQLGAKKQNFKVVVAGASEILNQEAPHDIAKRNHLAAEGLLTKNNIPIAYKDFGGNFYRRLKMESSHITVEIPGHGEIKI